MGRRGPRPLAREILEAHGSWRTSLLAGCAVPPPGRPVCPAWLGPDARAAWNYVTGWLDAMGMLAAIDRYTLARYCELYSRWKRAEKFIQRNGETYKAPGKLGGLGLRLVWPQVQIASQLAECLRALEREFGLAPRSRWWIDPTLQRPGHDMELQLLEELVRRGGPREPSRGARAMPRRPTPADETAERAQEEGGSQ